MIKKIELANVATFKDLETFEPNIINYLFGGNGTGKTTIGKVIYNCDSHSECSINWSLNPTETIIYNKDFVEKNFSQSESIKGIFTLGKNSTEVKQKLEDARGKVDELTEKIQSIKEHIEKNEIEFKEKEENYIERAWSVKDKYMEHFKPAYRGYLGSKKSFFEKCLNESTNESDLLEEQKIIEKCDQVFSESLSRYNEIKNSDFSKLIDLQQSKVLREKIIGKEDLEIGKLIRKLNNSDWVKEGLGYLDHSNEVCPFCQQSVADNLRSEIESFFDESYRRKIDTLEKSGMSIT
ncbi:MAG: AAA family ATPase [Balneolaceae bacterium]|nr:AAA family ATPase [Balneolaceae bacterium]